MCTSLSAVCNLSEDRIPFGEICEFALQILQWWAVSQEWFTRFSLCPLPLFTKQWDVLPPNLAKTPGREIGCFNYRIVLKFDRHLGSGTHILQGYFTGTGVIILAVMPVSRLCVNRSDKWYKNRYQNASQCLYYFISMFLKPHSMIHWYFIDTLRLKNHWHIKSMSMHKTFVRWLNVYWSSLLKDLSQQVSIVSSKFLTTTDDRPFLELILSRYIRKVTSTSMEYFSPWVRCWTKRLCNSKTKANWNKVFIYQDKFKCRVKPQIEKKDKG